MKDILNFLIFLFVFLFLFLTSCSSIPKTETNQYTCVMFTAHGSYAHLNVAAPTIKEATQIAETVKNRLYDKRLIPDCAVECFNEY